MRSIFERIWNQAFRVRYKGSVTFKIGDHSSLRYDRIQPASDCQVLVGQDCIIHARIAFDRSDAIFKCGDRCFIGNSHIVCSESIIIDDDVIISWGVTIVDHNSHAIEWAQRSSDVLDWGEGKKDWSSVKTAPVRIRDKAWIGFNAIILKGITIGEGAVVAAGAVVTKDVPPHSIVAGNPARVVRSVAEPQE